MFVKLTSLWIEGTTHAGKTTQLVKNFFHWVENRCYKQSLSPMQSITQNLASSVLVLSANDDNRRKLFDKLSSVTRGKYAIHCKTPLGFMRDELKLFWPLLFERLKLKEEFPLFLRTETEQEFATKLWKPYLEKYQISFTESNEFRFIRQTLDLLQLASASGVMVEDISSILEYGLQEEYYFLKEIHNFINTKQTLPKLQQELITEWQQWCFSRGIVTYGLIYNLYWQYLLPNSQYRECLINRYHGVFADDIDDYPAITKDLFQFFINHQKFCVFTYNPYGQVRLGLSADPDYLRLIKPYCNTLILPTFPKLFGISSQIILEQIDNPLSSKKLPYFFTSIETSSRAKLLKKTANFIINAIENHQVTPKEIVIIAPGLDEIARYTLIETLSIANIPVRLLNEQRPLISFPIIRALLTLLGLVFPGLGKFVEIHDIAQMLTTLSYDYENHIMTIDPVRAGILADNCFYMDKQYPKLLPLEQYSRWDRIGAQAAEAYKKLYFWVKETRYKIEKEQPSNPIEIIDSAIKIFIESRYQLPHEQLLALQELTETVQHFWEIDYRLQKYNTNTKSLTNNLIDFIQLLKKGIVTANPKPEDYFSEKTDYVTLTTIFQYRSLRSSHNWHLWLDTSSHLWETAGASVLFCAQLFLRNQLSNLVESEENKKRLKRILMDLLGRVNNEVILCHSDLNIKGMYQSGPLSNLISNSKIR